MKYRNWHQFIPLSMIGVGWKIIYQNPLATPGDWICLAGVVVIATEIGWQINAGLVLQNAGRNKDAEPTVENALRQPPRVIPELGMNEITVTQLRDLSPKAVTQLTTPKSPAPRLDRRIQTWSYGVTYLNAPMTQAFWCVGKNKSFSKPAYVAWISYLLENKIVVPINPNADRSTYETNGRAGKAYVKALADERVYIPFPTYESSETSTAFLRAQMRKRSTEGEGGQNVQQ